MFEPLVDLVGRCEICKLVALETSISVLLVSPHRPRGPMVLR